MLIDNILSFMVSGLVGLIGLLPAAPDLTAQTGYIGDLIGLVNPFFFPVGTLWQAIGMLVTIYTLGNAWKVIRFVINVIRGAGA